MSYYSVNLPSYTIGEGCYKEIPHTTRLWKNSCCDRWKDRDV